MKLFLLPLIFNVFASAELGAQSIPFANFIKELETVPDSKTELACDIENIKKSKKPLLFIFEGTGAYRNEFEIKLYRALERAYKQPSMDIINSKYLPPFNPDYYIANNYLATAYLVKNKDHKNVQEFKKWLRNGNAFEFEENGYYYNYGLFPNIISNFSDSRTAIGTYNLNDLINGFYSRTGGLPVGKAEFHFDDVFKFANKDIELVTKRTKMDVLNEQLSKHLISQIKTLVKTPFNAYSKYVKKTLTWFLLWRFYSV